jgi:hypothetical protein
MKKNIIKPIGLKGNEINERMKELMGLSSVNENKTNIVVELTKMGPDGNAYAIIRENHEWYIKVANKTTNLVAEDFKYIGGLQNKKDEAYSSYTKAVKHLTLKLKSLAEAYNYDGEFNIFKNDNLLNENMPMAGGFSEMKGNGFSGHGNLEGHKPMDEMYMDEAKKKNPWAICTASVGREDKDKYESCVMDVKKKMGMDEGMTEEGWAEECWMRENMTDEEMAIDEMIASEELHGGQKKLDLNKNGKLDGDDFKMLRGGKKEMEEEMTDKQKKFAALAPPKDKITYADKIAGATKKENMYESKNSFKKALDTLDELINSLTEGDVKKKILKETKYKLKLAGSAPEPAAETPEPAPAPIDDAPPMDSSSDSKSDLPFKKEPFDAGVEADEESDPKKFIEQLTGKLGQSLRKYTETQGQPDFSLEKFAINSLLSATHTSQMDDEDKKDIISKIEKSGSSDTKDTGEQESNAPTETPDESSDEDLDFGGGDENLGENFFLENPKKISIFAPEGTEEAKYNKKMLENMHEESNNYMFWQNLKTIHHAAGELLGMDQEKIDQLLSDGHGWALDHIATSADDIEEVYHFVENSVNDYQEHSEDEWAEPMEMTSEESISDDLKYHLENNIPLNETIYRLGSEKYFNLVKEVKNLYLKKAIKLNENDAFIVNEFDNDYVIVDGNKMKMNFIYEDVEAEQLNEAEYQGKKVELGKPKRGGSKKFYVYVKNPKTGKIKKVSFGAKAGGGNLAVKLRDPKARKAFADRHNCKQKNDKTKAGYWACRLPRYAKSLGLSGGGTWW